MMHLTRREKRLAIGMAAVIVVWAVYGVAVRPAQERISTLQRVIPEKQNDLEHLQEAAAQYLSLRRDVQTVRTRIAQQDGSFELMPFLESLIARHQLDEHLVKMDSDPMSSQSGFAETAVTIELKTVGLRQLLAFLETVENTDAVIHIAGLQIRQDHSQEGTLAATVRIVSPRPQTDGSDVSA